MSWLSYGGGVNGGRWTASMRRLPLFETVFQHLKALNCVDIFQLCKGQQNQILLTGHKDIFLPC